MLRPRTTDWLLALIVAAGLGTGLWSFVVGDAARWWVFALHAATGYGLATVLVPKLWRVRRRLVPRTAGAWFGLLSTVLALLTLMLGVGWVWGGRSILLGYNLLNWHVIAGFVLTALVSWHMLVRARPVPTAELQDRRQALRLGVIGLAALACWPLQQRLVAGMAGPNAARRFTGSRQRDDFRGNAFPVVMWMADRIPSTDKLTWQLRIHGLVARPLTLGVAELTGNAMLTATLDCTGGWATTQHWHGTTVAALLDQAGALPDGAWVQFHSVTGYRWSLPLAAARTALIATHVGNEVLSAGHGAPLRLVAPNERGLAWVKWLTAIEVRAHADPSDLLAINLSGVRGPATE